MNASDPRRYKRSSLKLLPQGLQGEAGPADTLILDLWPPELRVTKLLCLNHPLHSSPHPPPSPTAQVVMLRQPPDIHVAQKEVSGSAGAHTLYKNRVASRGFLASFGKQLYSIYEVLP